MNKNLKYFPVLTANMVNNIRHNSNERKALWDLILIKSENGSRPKCENHSLNKNLHFKDEKTDQEG